MKSKKGSHFKLSLAFSLALAITTSFPILGLTQPAIRTQGIPSRWDAKAYKPPANLGTPGRREPAGTRGGCVESRQQLKSLVPVNSYGATVAEYPTLLFYVPTISGESNVSLEFALKDDEDNDLYKSSLQTTGKGGIISISIPKSAGIPPLKVNKDYYWVFSMVCDPDAGPGQYYVDGYIRRVALNPSINNQLQQATAKDKVRIYAASELWFDTVASLAELRRSNPQDSTLTADWEKLLKSVDLDGIAKEFIQTE